MSGHDPRHTISDAGGAPQGSRPCPASRGTSGEYESMKSRETLIRLKKFQVDEKRRRVAQIEGMIADFQRMSVDLEREIQAEQERAGINDPVAFRLSDLCQGRDPAPRKPDPLGRRAAHPARGRQEPAGRSLRGTEEGRAARRARPGARARRGERPRAGRPRQHRPDARPPRRRLTRPCAANELSGSCENTRGDDRSGCFALLVARFLWPMEAPGYGTGHQFRVNHLEDVAPSYRHRGMGTSEC